MVSKNIKSVLARCLHQWYQCTVPQIENAVVWKIVALEKVEGVAIAWWNEPLFSEGEAYELVLNRAD